MWNSVPSRRLLLAATAAAAAALALPSLPNAIAQPGEKEQVAAKAVVTPARVAPGGKATLKITLALEPGFHINANKPADEFLIPTVFTPKKTSAGLTFGKIAYPAAASVTESYSDKPLQVYQDKAVISVPITVAKTAKPGRIVVGGDLRVQACNSEACFPPTTLKIATPLTIAATTR